MIPGSTFVLPEPCQFCYRSRKGAHEGDGRLYCVECGSHLQQFEAHFDDEQNPFGLTPITDCADNDEAKILTGPIRKYRSKRSFIVIYQFILKKWCRYFITQRGFPVVFEAVLRDLWLLRLVWFPYAPVQNTEQFSVSGSLYNDTSDRDFESGPESIDARSSRSKQSSIDGLHTCSTADTFSVVSSMANTRAIGRSGRDLEKMPLLIDGLALCYMASLALRLPVRIGDIYRWTKFDGFSLVDISSGIPKLYFEELNSQHSLQINADQRELEDDELYNACIDLMISYERDLGISLPCLNWQPLLVRYIIELAVPLDVYMGAKIVSGLMSFTYKFKSVRPGVRYSGLDFPELQIICCLIISLKLLYPIDGLSAQEDCKYGKFDWYAWKMVMEKSLNPSGQDLTDEHFNTITQDYAWHDMKEDEMMQYVKWFDHRYARTKHVKQRVCGAESELDNYVSGSDIGSEDTTCNESTLNRGYDEYVIDKIQERVFILRSQLSCLDVNEKSERCEDLQVKASPYVVFKNIEEIRHWEKCEVEELSKIAQTYMQIIRIIVKLSSLSAKRVVNAVFLAERRLGKISSDDWNEIVRGYQFMREHLRSKID